MNSAQYGLTSVWSVLVSIHRGGGGLFRGDNTLRGGGEPPSLGEYFIRSEFDRLQMLSNLNMLLRMMSLQCVGSTHLGGNTVGDIGTQALAGLNEAHSGFETLGQRLGRHWCTYPCKFGGSTCTAHSDFDSLGQ